MPVRLAQPLTKIPPPARGSSLIANMARLATLTAKKLLALEPSVVREIKDFRFLGRIKTESGAIRRLIKSSLEAAKKKDT